MTGFRTPGLKWRKHGEKIFAYWIRSDAARRARYDVSSVRLWSGPVGIEPTGDEMARISRECLRLQAEQRAFLLNPNLRRKKRYRQPGFIYFWLLGMHVKIGFTTTVRERISQLQIGSAKRGELLGVMPGSVEVEKFLHWLFRGKRCDGEWFEFDAQLSDFIRAYAGTLDERRSRIRRNVGNAGIEITA